MDNKPKARSPAKRPAKAKKTAKEKPQRERFIEAARSIGVDESGKEFETALKRIVPSKRLHRRSAP
jgi:hypothetical protein